MHEYLRSVTYWHLKQKKLRTVSLWEMNKLLRVRAIPQKPPSNSSIHVPCTRLHSVSCNSLYIIFWSICSLVSVHMLIHYLLPTTVWLVSVFILAQSKWFLYKNIVFVKFGKVGEEGQAYFSTKSQMSCKSKLVTAKNKNEEILRIMLIFCHDAY